MSAEQYLIAMIADLAAALARVRAENDRLAAALEDQAQEKDQAGAAR